MRFLFFRKFEKVVTHCFRKVDYVGQEWRDIIILDYCYEASGLLSFWDKQAKIESAINWVPHSEK